MSKFSDRIQPAHAQFIARQHLFFVATAPLEASGHVNLSPKGMDAFVVLSRNRVAYLDMTGSGNETSAHLLQNGRITIMFCAFDGAPNILRLYGSGRSVLPGDPEWMDLYANFNPHPGTRQIILADIYKVQTSCGYSVPLYSYEGERDQLDKWVARKGIDGLDQYRRENNLKSIDGLPTALGQQQQRREPNFEGFAEEPDADASQPQPDPNRPAWRD
jgi:hypothetical protein